MKYSLFTLALLLISTPISKADTDEFRLRNYYSTFLDPAFTPQKTASIGSKTAGPPFSDTPSKAAQLAGFAAMTGDWYGIMIISSIQPIYEDINGRFRGDVIGRKTDVLPIVIEAKPGFAVSGLVVSAPENHVHGFKVLFKKVDLTLRDLSSEGAYESEWVGIEYNNKSKKIDGGKRPAIGVYGYAGDWLAGIGLLLRK